MTTTKFTAEQIDAIEAADAEGLAYFWAKTHVGGTGVSFVGQTWADGGYGVEIDDDGNETPVCDVNGNSVSNFEVEPLDPNNPRHLAQIEEWYGYGS